MPVFLFTYHAHGSWMPDRERGYLKRGRGVLAKSEAMALRYRQAMKSPGVALNADHQRKLIDAAIDSQSAQHFRCFGVATDPTHVHALVAWTDDRDAVRMRAAVKSSLSRALNQEFGKRKWLSEGGSRKRVRNRTHFDYLLEKYLPKHAGAVWTACGGFLGRASRTAWPSG